ncbi:MAG TPA: hypothetical protein VH397_18225 [Xanthobacteraceae bacterium]
MNAHSEDLRQARADARADLIRRLFAVAVSIGFAATLAQMAWVRNGTLPGPAELNQTLILATALLAAILGWESHLLSTTERPLFGFWRFLINLVLVFIYMFLLLASAHPECVLWTLAVIFVLYVVWDIVTMRDQIASYDAALARAPRIGAAQIWDVYAGGFAGRAQIPPAPAITLACTGYFVLLALAGNGRAYAHVRTTCVFALIGLLGYWVDAASPPGSGAARHGMRRRAIVILVALAAATIYFRLISHA